MAKPDTINKIWADVGVKVTPSDAYIDTGWTLDIPPYEYFNFAFNKWDVALKTLNEQGVFEWDAETVYGVGSKVIFDGLHFISKIVSNVGVIPFTLNLGDRVYSSENWKVDDGSDVGVIQMFDGNTPTTIDGQNVINGQAGQWVDDITLPGWFACVDGNQYMGCQNLVDRFIVGKEIIGAGSKTGVNSYSLTSAQLPAHTHSIGHNHPAKTSESTSVPHTHSATVRLDYASGTQKYGFGPHSGTTTTDSSSIQTSGDTAHTHSVNLDAYVGNSGDGSFANDVIDNKPANYSLLYIRKCY